MKTRLMRLFKRKQQLEVVSLAAEMRCFTREIVELRHLFELRFAQLASERTLAQCHASLENIQGLLTVLVDQEAVRAMHAAAARTWQETAETAQQACQR